jgi:aromatic ring-opening dioxygenase LigB subunit
VNDIYGALPFAPSEPSVNAVEKMATLGSKKTFEWNPESSECDDIVASELKSENFELLLNII